uniref:Wsv025-like protein n=1 Tax=Sesarmops intermedium nimavirus TaxID=2133796 RepID=A0A401IPT7_9VIRU|nr:MAG: wsv025-like protein [Sesarmops intermedium nimavirus]GBG35611.1 wsv025-like protein [Sesarmops intermedium nimavirus]
MENSTICQNSASTTLPRNSVSFLRKIQTKFFKLLVLTMMISPEMGKQQQQQPSASRRRAVWSNTVAISRQQQQQKLLSDDSDDRHLISPKRRRKTTFIGKRRKRSQRKIKKTNKVANFFRNTTPTQRLKFITACIIAGIKITSILLVSLL